MAPAKSARARMRAQARKKKQHTRAAAKAVDGNTPSRGTVAPSVGGCSLSTESAASFPVTLASGLAHLERGEIERAISVLRRATLECSSSSSASDGLARALLEAGDPCGAEAELKRGVGACEASFERRMNLAQLACDPMEGIGHLEKGISELAMTNAGNEDEKRLLRIRANCALAEMLLTAAENGTEGEIIALDARCEAAVAAAIGDALPGELGEIEALVCLANLRLSQGRMDDARTAMRTVWNGVKGGLNVLVEAGKNGMGDVGSEEIVAALDRLPEGHVRIAIGKQFVETGLWSFGIRVLESVLLECDFNVEVWYMLGLCYLRNGKIAEARDAITSLGEARESPDGFDGMLDDRFVEELVRDIVEEEKKMASTTSDRSDMMDES